MLLVAQNFKDFVELLDGIGILLTLLGGCGAGLRYWMTHAQRQAAGEKAVQQVNTMAENHMPHIQESLQSLDEKADKHTELLVSMDKNISILVDRSWRPGM